MSLNVATLAYELLKILDKNDPEFMGYPDTPADVANNWSTVYDTYAKTAQDVSGDTLLVSHPEAFVAALTASLPPGATGTALLAADAFEAAFIAYWTGATFNIGIPPIIGNIGGTGLFSVELSSVVASVTPNVLSGKLQIEFATFSTDAISKSLSIAAAFHQATTTAVNVLISGLDTTPSPTGPLPITNTGLIF